MHPELPFDKTIVPEGEKSSRYQRMVGAAEMGQSIGAPFSMLHFQQTLEKSVFLYAAAVRLAQVLAASKFRIINTRSGDDATGAAADDLRELLRDPNPDQDCYAWSYSAFLHLVLDGETYAEKARDARGRVTELWVLNPWPVHPIPDRTGRRRVAGYEVVIDGHTIRLGVDDVIPWLEYNPRNPYRGLAPTGPLSREIAADMEAALYNHKLLQNGARVGGVISPKEGGLGLTEDELRRLVTSIENRHRGGGNAGKLAVISEPVNFQPDTIPPKDMDFINLRKFAREAVSAAFGVPPILMHNYDSATYANANQQVESFYDHTGRPRLMQWFGALNKFLVWPEFGKEIQLEPDWVGIQNQIEDTGTRTETARNWYLNGLATLNEARSKIGLDSLGDDGEVFFVPLNGTVARVDELQTADQTNETDGGDQAGAAPPPPPGQEGEGEGDGVQEDDATMAAHFPLAPRLNGQNGILKIGRNGSDFQGKASHRRRQIIERAHLAALDRAEQKMAARIEGYLADQQTDLLKRAKVALPSDDIEDIFGSVEEEARKAFDALAPVILEVIRDSGELHGERLDKALVKADPSERFDIQALLARFGLENSRVASYLDSTFARRMVQFAGATLKGLRDAVGSLTERILGTKLFGRQRALTVAKTETIGAFNLGALEAFRANGAPMKSWLSVQDEKVRDSHVDADTRYTREPIPMEQPFVLRGRGVESALMYPGDPNGPEHEVINCRCALVPEGEVALSAYAEQCKSELRGVRV